MNFKKWVKSIQAAAYNGARTVVIDTFFDLNRRVLPCFKENKKTFVKKIRRFGIHESMSQTCG